LKNLLSLISTQDSSIVGGSHSHPWQGTSQPQIARIVSGFTDVGYSLRKRQDLPNFVSTKAVEELRIIEWPSNGVRIGASMCINEIVRHLKDYMTEHGEEEALRAIVNQSEVFANNQVRDMGTLGGSLGNCSHLSDLVHVMAALEAEIDVVRESAPGEMSSRNIQIGDWVVSDGKTSIESDEIIRSIFIPKLKDNSFVSSFKQGVGRRLDTLALVNGTFRLDFDGDTITKTAIVIGGVGVPGLRAKETEAFLLNKKLDETTSKRALEVLQSELPAILKHSRQPDAWRREYQGIVIKNKLYQFFLEAEDRRLNGGGHVEKLHEGHKGKQNLAYYVGVEEKEEEITTRYSDLFESVEHSNAWSQVSGACKYTMDIAVGGQGLHGALITSTIANGKILSIDDTAVRKWEGVEDIFYAQDTPNNVLPGFRPGDSEPIFAEGVVEYVGQPVGIVVASTRALAQEAANSVKIKYEEREHALSFEKAEKLGHLYEVPPLYGMSQGALESDNGDKYTRVVSKGGDIEEKFAQLDAGSNSGTVEGIVDLGHGQLHFYFEPHNCVVEPEGPSRIRIASSTQSPSHVVDTVSQVLGLSQSDVVCEVDRVGGGFGGKQLRAGQIAAMAAVPAYVLKRPVKLVLERETDSMWCPGRSPCSARYKAGWKKRSDGKVTLEAVKICVDVDGGFCLDYSRDIMETIIYLLDSGYDLGPVIRMEGRVAKTNKGSYTATRGFGKPQASAIIECVLDHIAVRSDTCGPELRRDLLYKKGDITHTGTEIGDDILQRVWSGVEKQAKLEELREECERFNMENKWKKRGVAIVPSKGNMGFVDSDEINRGLALVHIHKDGSISVSHSGVEMGQGLSTRLAQICSEALNVPSDLIRIQETTSSVVPNTPPTTMVSTDLIGGAIVKACNELRGKLEEIKTIEPGLAMEEGTNVHERWRDLISLAYKHGLSLSVSATHASPKLVFNWEQGQGDTSYFFVWGAAVSVCEVDLVTGTRSIVKSTIVQDCGERSANPRLDVGQVEGGFMYGVGYYMQEDVVWNFKDQSMFSPNVDHYKLPSHDDTPKTFDVNLLRYNKLPNSQGVFGTKGIGEANIQLALSAYLAVKEAIRATRKERNMDEHFVLDFPATSVAVMKALVKE